MKLPKINGKTVKEQVEWLKKENCGCYHFHLTDTDNYRMHICIGWHDLGDGPKEKGYHNWKIAWKIGMETFNNAMQTDLDIDFIMPYDEATGDVYDTESTIKGITTMKGWNALAAEMNKAARETVKWQMDYEKRQAKKEAA
jgi:hypothetical protein